MDKIERTVTVTVTTNDRVGTYEVRRRENAERTFPADVSPSVVAAWAGRTAVAQLRDAEAAFPLPKPEPEKSVEQRLEAIATAPTDEAAAKEAGDDLPF